MAPLHVTKKGMTAFDHLDVAFTARTQVWPFLRQQLQEANPAESSGPLPDTIEKWWERGLLMLKSVTTAKNRDDDDPGEFLELHAALGVPCTRSIVDFCLLQYKDQLKVVDSKGRLPLHVAAQHAAQTHTQGWDPQDAYDVEDHEKEWEDILCKLVRLDPSAAQASDSVGHLPLHLLLKSGATSDRLEEGLNILLEAAPDALERPDPLTGLLPFQVAAAVEAAEVDDKKGTEAQQVRCIYQLLRASPALVRSAIPR